LAPVLLILKDINEFSDARASFRTGFYPKNKRTAGEKNGIKGTPKQSRGTSALLFFWVAVLLIHNGRSCELVAAAAEFDLRPHTSCNGFLVDVIG